MNEASFTFGIRVSKRANFFGKLIYYSDLRLERPRLPQITLRYRNRPVNYREYAQTGARDQHPAIFNAHKRVRANMDGNTTSSVFSNFTTTAAAAARSCATLNPNWLVILFFRK